MSHSPLMTAGAVERVDAALDDARAFVAAFDPELVVIFGPDHYLGFRYELMPPFCIGTAASAIGDYGTTAGAFDVPQPLADDLVAHLLAASLDVAMSEKMVVDHGIAQPLEVLFGSSAARPVIPVFVNCVAAPLGPLRRARLLGAAVGEWARRLDRRVLVVGSGGLSHDPPVPTLRGSPPAVAAYLVSRRRTPAEQAAREAAVRRAGEEFARGDSPLLPLNPTFDEQLLRRFADGELGWFDDVDVAWLVEQGGGSVQEVRTWVAAHAALGSYRTESTFYQPVPEWIIGFAVTIASEGVR